MSIDIKAIKERADKATPGPWETDSIVNEDGRSSFNSYAVFANQCVVVDALNSSLIELDVEYDEDGANVWDRVGQANADFIAHARTDIPALITEAEKVPRLEAENARLREVLKPFAALYDEILKVSQDMGLTPEAFATSVGFENLRAAKAAFSAQEGKNWWNGHNASCKCDDCERGSMVGD